MIQRMGSKRLSTVGVVFLLCCLSFLNFEPAYGQVPSSSELVNEAESGSPGSRGTVDRRWAEPLRDLNGSFPFSPPSTRAEWESRRTSVQRRVQFAAGQWPEIERAAPKGVVHGRVDRPGYSVERVYIESLPGHFVTGSLYRPQSESPNSQGSDATQGSDVSPRRRPAVLSPHGHWDGGRFHAWSDEEVQMQIAEGGEKFAIGGKYPLQARCVQLARMGCVVFLYDMVGYADSQQISASVIHGWRAHRPEMEGISDWGFFSAQAELNMISPFALQTYNSLVALDWLRSLPDVDPERIGVTGASGGGTQTFILGAVDPRPAVIMPVVMVSTSMQGGCPCENALCLRLDTGNVEIAGLCAPRPLGLVSANDWTVAMETSGYPQLQQLYRLLDAEDKVHLASLTQFGHNYNAVSRSAMYAWMNRHLQLGAVEPLEEQDYVPLSRDELTVWNEQHPAPLSGPDHERSVVRSMAEAQRHALEAMHPHDKESLARFRTLMEGVTEALIARRLPAAADVDVILEHEIQREDFLQRDVTVKYLPEQEAVPGLILCPNSWNKQIVLWLVDGGKEFLIGADGGPSESIRKLLSAGKMVVGVDLLFFGSARADDMAVKAESPKLRFVNTDRDLACYTFGYNRCLVAQRACDILTTIAAIQKSYPGLEQIQLVASGESTLAASLTLSPLSAQGSLMYALDTGGFRYQSLSDWHDPRFVPGACKYGDLGSFLALAAPSPLLLHGENEEYPAILSSAYALESALDNLKRTENDNNMSFEDQVVRWLIER
jgi:hypothetical protein